jgi:hypothetical protein
MGKSTGRKWIVFPIDPPHTWGDSTPRRGARVEGSGLVRAGGVIANIEFAFVRWLVGDLTKDTGSNVADFVLVATDPSALSPMLTVRIEHPVQL